jgi:hypothetical protein
LRQSWMRLSRRTARSWTGVIRSST